MIVRLNQSSRHPWLPVLKVSSDVQIVYYPHPTLRHVSRPVKRVDRELRGVVAQMFELMYEANGIGLAANQVDLPLQLFVLNLAGRSGDGEELVFINPVLSRPKGMDVAEEGCLSLPGVVADVQRPAQIELTAFDLSGYEVRLQAEGLLARAIQHEFDHLQGVLFIDRVSESDKRLIEEELSEFELEFSALQASGAIPDDATIAKRRKSIEEKYC